MDTNKDTEQEAPERIWIARPVEFKSLISRGGPAFDNDVEYRRVDPLAAPDERDKALEDRLWEALKQHACKVPDEAKLIVFLGEGKFREAVGPPLATVRKEVALAQRESDAQVADAIQRGSRTLTAKNTAMTIAIAIRNPSASKQEGGL